MHRFLNLANNLALMLTIAQPIVKPSRKAIQCLH